MLAGQFTPGFKCGHLLKDLTIVQGMANDVGLHSSVIEMARDHYAQLVLRGEADSDTSALILLKRG